MRSIVSLVVLFLLQACQTMESPFPNDIVANHMYANCVYNKDIFPSAEAGAVHCRCMVPAMMESFKPEALNAMRAVLQGELSPGDYIRAVGKPFKGAKLDVRLSEACPNLDKYWKDLKAKRLLEPSPAMRKASEADVCVGVKYGNPGFIAEAKNRGLTERECPQLAERNTEDPVQNTTNSLKAEQDTEDFIRETRDALTTAKNNPTRHVAMSEIDLVRQQIRECWSLPDEVREAEDLSIEVKMKMNPDGTVRQAQIMDQDRLGNDPLFRTAAESALRAVLHPNCNPLNLPLDKYHQWQNMILTFDPRQMFDNGNASGTSAVTPQVRETPKPTGSPAIEERLSKLKELFDKGLLTPDEAKVKRREILQGL